MFSVRHQHLEFILNALYNIIWHLIEIMFVNPASTLLYSVPFAIMHTAECRSEIPGESAVIVK